MFKPQKKKVKARPVGRPRKYGNRISVNELHNFNDLLEFDKWCNEKYSKLSIESTEPKTTRKRFSSQQKEEIKHFYLAYGNYRGTTRVFQLQDCTVRIKVKRLRKVKVVKVLKEEKRGKEILKVQDVHYRTQLP